MRTTVAILFVAIAVAGAAKLPSYFKPCKRSDPKINECLLKNFMDAFPTLINGEAKLGIPKLDPFEFEKLTVGDGKTGNGGLGLTMTCHKCKVVGAKGLRLEDVKLDMKNKHLQLKAVLPQLSVVGSYSVNGKVLVLPISGEGDADVTIGDLKFTYNVGFDLVKNKSGKDYAKLKNPSLSFTADKFHIHLTNLFNGDPALGKQMNTFLNENWKELLREFGPAITEAVNKVISSLVNGIMQKVPFDEVLPK